ncbi:MAG: hemerythrin domain-containing protein [Pseudomonadota bacterium]
MHAKTLDEFRAIETDHLLMQRILRDAVEAEAACLGLMPCTLAACERRSLCVQTMRECLHRAQFASLGLFDREEKVIRKLAPAERFRPHADDHELISRTIRAAIRAFADDHDVAAAFVRLHEITRLYEAHHDSHDAECRALLLEGRGRAKCKPPAGGTFPELPRTGHPRLDEEHAMLRGIHDRAKTICDPQSTDCAGCTPDRQQDCTSAAVELLADAIKFMVDHFRHEDELIRRHSTPEEAEAHLLAHAEISRQVSHLVNDYEDNNTAMCMYRLAETLRIWLTQHVAEHDLPVVRASLAPGQA